MDYDAGFGPARAYRFDIDERLSATIALFPTARAAEIRAFASNAAFAVGAVSLPLALIVGFILGRQVHRRLNALAATVDDVTAGRMEARAEITGSGDEFERLSISMNRMLDRMAAMERNIEQVSVGVAHDLKTPLGNIRGRLELMARDLDDQGALERHIDMAEHHIQTMLRIFDALLRLGEVEAGVRVAGFKEVDLTTAISELAQSMAPIFTDADKQLAVEVTPGVTILGDEALLIQMASNLLENVLDHSRDGAKAWVTLSREDGAVCLEVGDDGPGVAALHRDRLFERFYRGDSSRSTPGNGLGLSLVRAISDLHDGELRVDADAPGFVLEIRLPT